MYNGIGLPTPRGSGTNGYVQRNLSTVHKVKDKNFKVPEDVPIPSLRRGNTDIIEHDRKRKIEVKCMEFESLLEDQGYSQDEIEKRVNAYRRSLCEENSKERKDKHGRIVVKETHEIAEAQMRKNEKLREAFGISEYFVDGSSFDPERRAKEIAAKVALEEETKKYALVSSPTSSGDDLAVVENENRAVSSSKKRKAESSPQSGTDAKNSKTAKKKKKKKKKKHKRKHASSSESERERSSQYKSNSTKVKKKDRGSFPVSSSKDQRATRRSDSDELESKKKHKKKTSDTPKDKSSKKSGVFRSPSPSRSDEDASKKRKQFDRRKATGEREKEKRSRASPSPVHAQAKSGRHSITDSSRERERNSSWKAERSHRKRGRSDDEYERKKSGHSRKRKPSSTSSRSCSEESRTDYRCDSRKYAKRDNKEVGGYRKRSPSASPKRKVSPLRDSSLESHRHKRRDLSLEVNRNRGTWSSRYERKEKPAKRKYRRNSKSASVSSDESSSKAAKSTLKSKLVPKSARHNRDKLAMLSNRGKDVSKRKTLSSDSEEERKMSPRFRRKSGKERTESEWKSTNSRSSNVPSKSRMTIENESDDDDDEITTSKGKEKTGVVSRRVDEERQSTKSKIKGRVESPSTTRVFLSPSRNGGDSVKDGERKELTSQRTSNVSNSNRGGVEIASKVANRDSSTSSSLSYSPMEKYPHRYQDILNDMPIKSRKEEPISARKTGIENKSGLMKEGSVSTSNSGERMKRNDVSSTKVSAERITTSPLPSAMTLPATKESATTETKINPPLLCLDDVPLPPERDAVAVSSKRESAGDRVSASKPETSIAKLTSTDIVTKLASMQTDATKSKFSHSPLRALSTSSRKRWPSSSSSDPSPKKRSRYSSLSSSSKSSRSSDRSNNDSPSSSSEYSSHAASSRRTRRSPSDSVEPYKSRRSSSYSSSESSRSGSRSSSVSKRKKRRRNSRSDSESRSDSSSSYSRSRSRSISIPRRRGSPSFLERRRITSRKRSISLSSSSSSTSTSSSPSSSSSTS